VLARKGEKKDESLPIAIATQGGLLTALAVLLVGMTNGARAWILLTKAGTAFLLSSALLKLLSAGVMQGIRMKADVPVKRPRPYDDVSDVPPAEVSGPAAPLEPARKVAS
jgi:hypothetical protein